jgi:hypothetical protein
VSQFAAGCAVCGFDLEAARAEAAERGPGLGERASALRPGWFHSATSRQDLFLAGVIVVLIVFFPIAGLGLAAWTAFDRDRNGDTRMRNVAIALVVVAIVFFAVPELRYGILFTLS